MGSRLSRFAHTLPYYSMLPRTLARSLKRVQPSATPLRYSAAFSTSSITRLSPLTSVSHSPVFIDKVHEGTIPAFRVLDGEGKLLPDIPAEWREKVQAIPDEVLVKMYRTQVFLPLMDTILSSSQRQGSELHSRFGALQN